VGTIGGWGRRYRSHRTKHRSGVQHGGEDRRGNRNIFGYPEGVVCGKGDNQMEYMEKLRNESQSTSGGLGGGGGRVKGECKKLGKKQGVTGHKIAGGVGALLKAGRIGKGRRRSWLRWGGWAKPRAQTTCKRRE